MVIHLFSIIFFIFREQKPNHGGCHISWSQRGSYLALGMEYLHHVLSTYLVSLSSSDRAGLWEKLELDMQVREHFDIFPDIARERARLLLNTVGCRCD